MIRDPEHETMPRPELTECPSTAELSRKKGSPLMISKPWLT